MKGNKKVITSLSLAFALALGGGIVSAIPTKADADNAASGKQTFDFTQATDFEDVSMFSVGVDPCDNNEALGYTDTWQTYAKDMDDVFTLDGGLKVNSAVYSGDAAWENRIYVRYNVEMMQYFEAELTYSYDDTAKLGWAGFMLGYTDYERQARWGDSPYGAEFFVQNNGLGTYAASKFNGGNFVEDKAPAQWETQGEHTLKLVADVSGISFYANGTLVNSITKEQMDAAGYALTEGSVGFMLTNAQFTVKSFSLTELSGTAEEPDQGKVYENNHDFTALTSFDDLTELSVGVDPVLASEDWLVHSKQLSEVFTLENGLKINTSLYGDTSSAVDNITYLRLNEQMKYFEAEMTYSYDAVTNGCAGFFLGTTDTTHQTRWPNNANGVELITQSNGLGAYMGNALGAAWVNTNYAANWVAAGDHTLSIVADENGIVFTVDGTVVTTITAEQLQKANCALIKAHWGVMFCNAQFTLKSLKYTNLAPEHTVCEDTDKNHVCDTCNNPVGTHEQAAGKHTCDYCNEKMSSCVDENKDTACDVCGGLLDVYMENYSFTEASGFDALTMFSAGIDPQMSAEDWMVHATEMNEMFTLENGLKINTSLYGADAVSENNVYVRYNKKQLKYFKAELVYSYDNANRNGWAGFFLGNTDVTAKTCWPNNQHGVEIFVQKNGLGTYSSNRLNGGGYTEKTSPAGWTEVGEHRLAISVLKSGITLYADGVEVISISEAVMQEKGYEIITANMGFMFTNGNFTAKSFKVSSVNELGEEYVAVEDIEVTAATEVNQFEDLAVTANVLPENASLKDVKYELPECASAVNGKLYFAKPGTYTVKAISADNEEIFDEITVTVKARSEYFAYDTATGDDFENYFVTSGGSKDGALAAIADYWTFNADGTMTLTEKKGSGVDSGYVLLYLKDVVNGLAVKSNSFEIVYMVRGDAATPNGWHGVGFAMADRTTVPNQSGISVFMQETAMKATVWGSGIGGVGGPAELNSLYTRDAWNMVKIRVYGEGSQTIEMYVNDMSTPAITATGTGIPAESVALFTTTTVTFGNVYFAYLDADGNALEVVYPESIQTEELPTSVYVGDKLQITATVAPDNANDKSLVYTTSDSLVATVSADGKINFLSEGEVTIKVSCKANPAVYKEFTITATKKEVLPTSVTFDATPDTAVVGGKYTLFVTVLPEEATNYAVTFTSSNTDVATVDEDGRLTYVGAGQTTITVVCRADESIRASFTLTVVAAAEPDQPGDSTDTPSDSTQGGSSSGNTAGDSTGGNGCNGTVVGASLLIPVLAAVAVVAMKKKED